MNHHVNSSKGCPSGAGNTLLESTRKHNVDNEEVSVCVKNSKKQNWSLRY